jgi:hypothetical protein
MQNSFYILPKTKPGKHAMAFIIATDLVKPKRAVGSLTD